MLSLVIDKVHRGGPTTWSENDTKSSDFREFLKISIRDTISDLFYKMCKYVMDLVSIEKIQNGHDSVRKRAGGRRSSGMDKVGPVYAHAPPIVKGDIDNSLLNQKKRLFDS